MDSSLGFFIDKITNSIENVTTGKGLDIDVLPLENSDLKQVLKKNGWNFNWKSELKYKDWLYINWSFKTIL